MRSLLGHRFLKWFAGDLRNRQKQVAPIFIDQIPETELDMAAGSDNPISDEDHAIPLAEPNDLQNKEERNKTIETEPKND